MRHKIYDNSKQTDKKLNIILGLLKNMQITFWKRNQQTIFALIHYLCHLCETTTFFSKHFTGKRFFGYLVHKVNLVLFRWNTNLSFPTLRRSVLLKVELHAELSRKEWPLLFWNCFESSLEADVILRSVGWGCHFF